MNRVVENYSRCCCLYRKDDLYELLPAGEFAYNSAITEDLGSPHLKWILGGIRNLRYMLVLDLKIKLKLLMN